MLQVVDVILERFDHTGLWEMLSNMMVHLQLCSCLGVWVGDSAMLQLQPTVIITQTLVPNHVTSAGGQCMYLGHAMHTSCTV